MTIQETILQITAQTIGNLVSNLAFMLLFIWGVKSIGQEIKEGVKKVPEWIETYHRKQMERIKVQEALDRRGT